MSEFLKPIEAAERLDVHINTMRAWIREGQLPSYRLGPRFTRVKWSEVLEALATEPSPAGAKSPSAAVSEEGLDVPR